MSDTNPVNSTRGAAIVGWGAALPDEVVTNADFEGRLDTSDQWITERTGIRERRKGTTTTELAVAAGKQALDHAGFSGKDIELLILATSTPDQTIPATAAAVADRLGLNCGTFDLNAACASFVYALTAGNGIVGSGLDRILIIGAETMSRITDQEDRTTAVLFGDGAGAVVLEASPDIRLLGIDFGTDGSAQNLLSANLGGFITMEGKEVYRRAVRATVDSAKAAMERAKVEAGDIALFVPHQANLRIIEAASQRLGIPMERAAIVLHRTGNTSAGSIPLALAEAASKDRLNDGDLVLFSGFGAGMTWASAVWRWGK